MGAWSLPGRRARGRARGGRGAERAGLRRRRARGQGRARVGGRRAGGTPGTAGSRAPAGVWEDGEEKYRQAGPGARAKREWGRAPGVQGARRGLAASGVWRGRATPPRAERTGRGRSRAAAFGGPGSTDRGQVRAARLPGRGVAFCLRAGPRGPASPGSACHFGTSRLREPDSQTE